MSLHNFFNYLDNKRVIIVGPSPSLRGKELGNMIDSYDIVVRIKRGFPVNISLSKDLGRKTNILITSLKVNPVKDLKKRRYNQNNFDKQSLDLMESELDFMCFAYPISIDPFNKFYKQYKILPIKNVQLVTAEQIKPHYFKFVEKLQTTHTVFLSATWLLLLSNLKELKIIGITFQKDGYLDEYKTKNMMEASKYRTLIRRKSNKKTVHNMNCEIKFFLENIWTDKRVILDKELVEILNFEDKKIKFIEECIPFWKPYYYGKTIDRETFDKIRIDFIDRGS